MNNEIPSYLRPAGKNSQEQELEIPSYLVSVEDRKKENQEGWGKYLGRTAARTGSRVVETLAGLPGDIVQAAKSLPELPSFGQQESFIQKAGKPYAEKFAEAIPTSNEIRDYSQQIFGDLVSPHGEGEKFADDIVSDFTLLALPVKGKIPFARALGTSVAGNLGKETVKKFGGSENAQNLTKLGIMMTAGLIGRESAKKFTSKLHDNYRSMIPETATIKTTNQFIEGLENLAKEMEKGTVSLDQAPAYKVIQDMSKRARDSGVLPTQELSELRKTINSYRFSRDLSPSAKFHFDQLDRLTNSHLEQYGKANPEFLKAYREANLASAGMAHSNFVVKAVSKALQKAKIGPTTAGIFAAHALPGATAAAPAVLGAAAVGQVSAVMHRVLTNPVLRKHYFEVLKAAGKDQTPLILKHLKELDKGLEKDQ